MLTGIWRALHEFVNFVHDPEIYTTVCRTEMAARLNIEKVPNQESSLLVVHSTSEPHL